MFKGTKPAGQPRTLRTRAETNDPGKFREGGVLPAEQRGEYNDVAEAAQPLRPGGQGQVADPQPFGNLR